MNERDFSEENVLKEAEYILKEGRGDPNREVRIERVAASIIYQVLEARRTGLLKFRPLVCREQTYTEEDQFSVVSGRFKKAVYMGSDFVFVEINNREMEFLGENFLPSDEYGFNHEVVGRAYIELSDGFRVAGGHDSEAIRTRYRAMAEMI